MFESLAMFLFALIHIIAHCGQNRLMLCEHGEKKMEQKERCISDRGVTAGRTELRRPRVADNVAFVGNFNSELYQ